MPKMKAVQVPRAGGDLEVVEREIPRGRDQDKSGFASKRVGFAIVMWSQKKACFLAFRILAFLDTKSPGRSTRSEPVSRAGVRATVSAWVGMAGRTARASPAGEEISSIARTGW